MLYGYKLNEFNDMWRLYVFDNSKIPPSISHLIQYWETTPKHSPYECVVIASKLAASHLVDTSKCREMVHDFIAEINRPS